jgi:tRNA (Thr-GGU) A37 N-methylase
MVTIEGIDGEALIVRGLDCVNGTPLLDIKPAMRAESPAGGGGA